MSQAYSLYCALCLDPEYFDLSLRATIASMVVAAVANKLVLKLAIVVYLRHFDAATAAVGTYVVNVIALSYEIVLRKKWGYSLQYCCWGSSRSYSSP